MPLFFLCLSETEAISAASTADLAVIGVTVVLGTAMSYYAWLARSLVSATLFTILGNVCKVLSIVINVMIWDKHATPMGLACLMLCLVAAFLYKPSPMRAERQPMPEQEQLVPQEDDSESEKNAEPLNFSSSSLHNVK